MIRRNINRIISCVMAAAMLLLAIGGLDISAVKVMASSGYTLEVAEAESLEAGKQYIFLEGNREYAMGVQNGYTSAYRQAVEIELDRDAGVIKYSGTSVDDIVWECMEGSDGLLKLYSQQRLDGGSTYAYLHYSGCDYVQLSSTNGEQHAYNSSDHTLRSWWSSNDPYYVYFAGAGNGFKKEAGNDYSHTIYAYEVISCDHSDCDHVEEVPATCLTSGNIEYWVCNSCGRFFSDSDLTIEVTDVTVAALGHDWDEGVVVTEPTATEDGLLKRTCKNDPSHVKYETIPMTGGVTSNVINIKPAKVTSLADGKQYIIMSYPSGGQALSAQVRSLYESSGSYNYLALTPVTIDETAGTAAFESADLAKLCIFTTEENPDVSGQFRLKNDDAYIYKYYSMIEMREAVEYASWFTYSSSGGLKHVNSDLVSSYPNIAVSSNVYKGVTGTGGYSPIYIYEAVLEMDQYTVTFDSNGGSGIDSQTVDSEGTVSRPDDPEREGYEFVGWYADEAHTVLYDFDLPVTANITLYAAWKAADGESETVYVKRVQTFAVGNEYIIVAAGRNLAMSCERGNESYDNSRAGKSITFNEPEEGKLTITFKTLEEKHVAIWTSTSQDGAGEVSLSINDSLLGTYNYASHYPADESDNIYFYIDGDYLNCADNQNSFMYDSNIWTGFRPNSGGSAIYVYQVVDEDYSHTEHTLVKTEEVPATCESAGTASYYTCTVCGELFKDEDAVTKISSPEVIPALGHDYGEWTELNGTQHQRVCSNDSSHIEKALHNWDDGVVTKEATSSEEGIITYTCQDCHAERYEAIAVTTGDCPESGSVGYIVEVEPATALEDGAAYIILSSDGKRAMTSENTVTQYGGYRLLPTDVTLEADSGRIVFPTSTLALESIWDCEAGTALVQDVGSLYAYMAYLWCGTSDMYANGGENIFEYDAENGKLYVTGSSSYTVGYDSDYQAFCTVPGNRCVVYKVNNIIGLIADNSHNLVRTAAKDPTCTAAGNTEYYQCSKCGQYFSDAEGRNGISLSDTVVAALGHSLIHHEAYDATCEENGSIEYYECERCGLFFADEQGKTQIAENSWLTDPTGHDYDDGVITTEPTCTEDGVKTYTCSNDNSHTYTESVPATGHSWYKTASFQVTCTEDGYDLYECRTCGENEKRNVKKATGHTPGDPVIENLIEAQLDKDGSYDSVVYCTVCHEQISRGSVVIPKTGHHIYVQDYTRGDDTDLADLVTNIVPEQYYIGEVTFSVSFDMACVVAMRREDGSYVRLYGTEADSAYTFTVNVDSDIYIAIAIKGDADLNGDLKSKDASVIAKYIQQTRDLTPLQLLAADVDCNEKIGSKDASIIVKSISAYELEWDIE